MKKKILFLLMTMTVVFIFAMILVPEKSDGVKAADGDYTYTVSGDAIEITHYNGSAETLDIGELNKDGKTVASIASGAFNDNQNLKSVVIPNGVTKIGAGAFSSCSNMVNVTIPDSVTSIGPEAFRSCTELTEITLPDNLDTIEDYMFAFCTNLKKITLPKNAVSINNFVFGRCSSLEEITIPGKVSYVGMGAFVECTSLSSISIDSTNTNFVSQDGVLLSHDKTTLLCYPAGKKDGNYSLPADVNTIMDFAFYFAPLSQVTLPQGLKEIGSNSFVGSKINSITIPDSVTTIGNYAFEDCSELVSIKLPAQLQTIPVYMCRGCSKLSSVSIPENVSVIENSAFYECKGLTTISIPDSVTSIGYDTFCGCAGLTSVVLPDNLTSVQSELFSGCSKLTSLILPQNLQSIEARAFKGCIGLKEIKIPESVTSINNYAFEKCAGISEISIPASASAIGLEVFKDCTNLSSINVQTGNQSYLSADGVLYNIDQTQLVCYPSAKIANNDYYTVPNSVKKIMNGAFRNSTLKEIALQNNLTSIASEAFYHCKNLTGIELPNTLQYIDTMAFKGCKSITSIMIPKSVTSIAYGVFSDCSSLETISVEEGNTSYKLVEGVLFSSDQTELVSYPAARMSSGSYEIPEGVAYIDVESFSGCTSLTELTLPASLEYLDYAVLKGCANLKDIHVSEDNSSLCDINGVLLNKDKTIIVYYPNGRTDATYDIPEGVDYIGPCAFTDSNLSDVTIPESVEVIEDLAFLNCKNMKSIIVPENISYIGACALGYLGDISEAELFGPSKADFGKDTFKKSVNKFPYSDLFTKNKEFLLYCYENTGGKDYAVRYDIKYKILDHTMNTCDIGLSSSSVVYDGTEKNPAVTVTYGNKALTMGVNYMVTYSNNMNKGTAKVTITGIEENGFSGTVEESFVITAKSVDKLTVSGIADQTYTGSAITPDVTVKDGTKLLVKDTDYTVSYLANIEPGTGAVKITGKGNYADSISKPFNILSKIMTQTTSKSINGMSASLSSTTFIYTGKEKAPKVTLKDGTAALVKDIDYTVDYTNNKEAGTATATITGIGKYSGTIKLTFTIKPGVPTVKSKAGHKKATISWSKVKGASGYEISILKSKTGKYSVIKTVSSSAKGLVKKKLKSGKKYYFKVRAYRTVNGEKIYGEFSAVKKCKVK